MLGPDKVIVLAPDPRAVRQLVLGLHREGVPVAKHSDAATVAVEKPAVAIVGGDRDYVHATRALLGATVPIVFIGRGERSELAAAGADEVIAAPAHLRDIVTVVRLLSGVARDQRDHLVGSLVETSAVFTLVRALASLGRSAVLTLARGLRRGEVRFYHGEVTSAQVGMIHGQAALHQLLLWTDARFEFAHEDIVRRQQIPLEADELFADAERFLEGVRESAGALSPSMVLEQDVQRVHNLGTKVPTEVHGVLRMFDGHRVLTDVLEDSPYRVFETLRVAQKALEAGLLRITQNAPRAAAWRPLLAIEEWLVGSERAATPPAGVATKLEIDWGELVPRVIGAEVGPLSGVVPASDAHGEIDQSSQARRAEVITQIDAPPQQKIFVEEARDEVHDVPTEPVVLPLAADAATEREARELAASREKAQAERQSAAEDARQYAARVKAAAEARQRAAAQVANGGVPIATGSDNSPSDGIVRAIATAETAKVPRGARASTPAPAAAEMPATDGPSPADPLPVRDVAAVPADGAAATPEATPVESEIEDAFFRRHESSRHVAPNVESFSDLDDDYQPQKFWDRVFGRKPKRP